MLPSVHPLLAAITRHSPNAILVGASIAAAPGRPSQDVDFCVGADEMASPDPAGRIRLPVVSRSAVTAIPAESMSRTLHLMETEDLIVEVLGADRAVIIAGETLAIGHGVRALVSSDVRSTRRVAVTLTCVLDVAPGAKRAASAERDS